MVKGPRNWGLTVGVTGIDKLRQLAGELEHASKAMAQFQPQVAAAVKDLNSLGSGGELAFLHAAVRKQEAVTSKLTSDIQSMQSRVALLERDAGNSRPIPIVPNAAEQPPRGRIILANKFQPNDATSASTTMPQSVSQAQFARAADGVAGDLGRLHTAMLTTIASLEAASARLINVPKPVVPLATNPGEAFSRSIIMPHPPKEGAGKAMGVNQFFWQSKMGLTEETFKQVGPVGPRSKDAGHEVIGRMQTPVLQEGKKNMGYTPEVFFANILKAHAFWVSEPIVRAIARIPRMAPVSPGGETPVPNEVPPKKGRRTKESTPAMTDEMATATPPSAAPPNETLIKRRRTSSRTRTTTSTSDIVDEMPTELQIEGSKMLSAFSATKPSPKKNHGPIFNPLANSGNPALAKDLESRTSAGKSSLPPPAHNDPTTPSTTTPTTPELPLAAKRKMGDPIHLGSTKSRRTSPEAIADALARKEAKDLARKPHTPTPTKTTPRGIPAQSMEFLQRLKETREQVVSNPTSITTIGESALRYAIHKTGGGSIEEIDAGIDTLADPNQANRYIGHRINKGVLPKAAEIPGIDSRIFGKTLAKEVATEEVPAVQKIAALHVLDRASQSGGIESYAQEWMANRSSSAKKLSKGAIEHEVSISNEYPGLSKTERELLNDIRERSKAGEKGLDQDVRRLARDLKEPEFSSIALASSVKEDLLDTRSLESTQMKPTPLHTFVQASTGLGSRGIGLGMMVDQAEEVLKTTGDPKRWNKEVGSVASMRGLFNDSQLAQLGLVSSNVVEIDNFEQQNKGNAASAGKRTSKFSYDEATNEINRRVYEQVKRGEVDVDAQQGEGAFRPAVVKAIKDVILEAGTSARMKPKDIESMQMSLAPERSSKDGPADPAVTKLDNFVTSVRQQVTESLKSHGVKLPDPRPEVKYSSPHREEVKTVRSAIDHAESVKALKAISETMVPGYRVHGKDPSKEIYAHSLEAAEAIHPHLGGKTRPSRTPVNVPAGQFAYPNIEPSTIFPDPVIFAKDIEGVSAKLKLDAQKMQQALATQVDKTYGNALHGIVGEETIANPRAMVNMRGKHKPSTPMSSMSGQGIPPGQASAILNTTGTPMGDEPPEKRSSTLAGRFGDASMRAGLYGAAAGSIYGGYTVLTSGISAMADFEEGLIRVDRVMSPIGASIGQLSEEAKRMGQTYGVALNEIVQGFQIFAQQGLAAQDILRQTEVAILATNVTELGLVQSTEALTAALKQFKLPATEAIRVLDSWNEIENSAAVNAGVLALATQRAATAAKNAGVNFDEFNGIVAAVGESTRKSGEQIGTSMKFIFSSMRADQSIKALQEVGIYSQDAAGGILSSRNALAQLRDRWDRLSDAQRQNVSLQIAGKRHANDFLIVMERWDRAMDLSTTSLMSQGSSMRENEKTMESLNKKLAQLSAGWQTLWVSMGETGAIDSLKSVVEMANNLLFVVREISGLSGGLMGGTFGTAIAAGAVATTAGIYGFQPQISGIVNGTPHVPKGKKGGGTSQAGSQAAMPSMVGASVANQSFQVQAPTPGNATSPVVATPIVNTPSGGSASPGQPMIVAGGDAGKQGSPSRRVAMGGAMILGAHMIRTGMESTLEEGKYSPWRAPTEIGTSALGNIGLASMFRNPNGGLWKGQGLMSRGAMMFAGLNTLSQGVTSLRRDAKDRDPRVQADRGIQSIDHIQEKANSAFSDVKTVITDLEKGRDIDPSVLNEMMDRLVLVTPEFHKIATSSTNLVEAFKKGRINLDVVRESLRGSKANYIFDTIKDKTGDSDIADMIKKRDDLKSKLAAEPDKYKAGQIYGDLQGVRGDLGAISNAFKALGLQSGLAGIGGSLALDEDNLRFGMKSTDLDRESVIKMFLRGFVQSASGLEIDTSQVLKSANEFSDRTDVTAESFIREGYIRNREDGPIIRMADGQIMAKFRHEVDAFVESLKAREGVFVDLSKTIEGIPQIGVQDIRKLVTNYSQGINALTRRNSDRMGDEQWMGQNRLVATGGVSESASATTGEALKNVNQMASLILDIQQNGVRELPTLPGLDNNPGSVARLLQQGSGAVMQVADNRKGIAIEGMVNMRSSMGDRLGSSDDQIKRYLEGLIRAYQTTGEFNANANDDEMGGISHAQIESWLRQLLGEDYSQVQRMAQQAGQAYISAGNVVTPEVESYQNALRAQATEVANLQNREAADKSGTELRAEIDRFGEVRDSFVSVLGQRFQYQSSVGSVRSLDEFMGGEEASSAEETLKSLLEVTKRNLYITEANLASAERNGAGDLQTTMLREDADRLRSFVAATSETIATFGQRIQSVSVGIDQVADQINRTKVSGDAAGSFGLSGLNAQAFTLNTLQSFLTQADKGQAEPEMRARLVTEIANLSKSIKRQQEEVALQRDLGSAGALQSSMIARLTSQLGLPSGEGAGVWLDQQQSSVAEIVQNAVAGMAGKFESGEDIRKFISELSSTIAPFTGGLREMSLARDTEYQKQSLLATPTQRILADHIQQLIGEGQSAENIFAHPMMAMAARENPLLSTLMEKALAAQAEDPARVLEWQQKMPGVLERLAKAVEDFVAERGSSITPTHGVAPTVEGGRAPIPMSLGSAHFAGQHPGVDRHGYIARDGQEAILHRGEFVVPADMARKLAKLGLLPGPGFSDNRESQEILGQAFLAQRSVVVPSPRYWRDIPGIANPDKALSNSTNMPGILASNTSLSIFDRGLGIDSPYQSIFDTSDKSDRKHWRYTRDWMKSQGGRFGISSDAMKAMTTSFVHTTPQYGDTSGIPDDKWYGPESNHPNKWRMRGNIEAFATGDRYSVSDGKVSMHQHGTIRLNTLPKDVHAFGGREGYMSGVLLEEGGHRLHMGVLENMRHDLWDGGDRNTQRMQVKFHRQMMEYLGSRTTPSGNGLPKSQSMWRSVFGELGNFDEYRRYIKDYVARPDSFVMKAGQSDSAVKLMSEAMAKFQRLAMARNLPLDADDFRVIQSVTNETASLRKMAMSGTISSSELQTKYQEMMGRLSKTLSESGFAGKKDTSIAARQMAADSGIDPNGRETPYRSHRNYGPARPKGWTPSRSTYESRLDPLKARQSTLQSQLKKLENAQPDTLSDILIAEREDLRKQVASLHKVEFEENQSVKSHPHKHAGHTSPDRKEGMKRAWAITEEMSKKSGMPKQSHLSEAMKIAWGEVQGVAETKPAGKANVKRNQEMADRRSAIHAAQARIDEINKSENVQKQQRHVRIKNRTQSELQSINESLAHLTKAAAKADPIGPRQAHEMSSLAHSNPASPSSQGLDERMQIKETRPLDNSTTSRPPIHRTNKSGGPDRETRERLRQQAASIEAGPASIEKLQARRADLQRRLDRISGPYQRRIAPPGTDQRYLGLASELDSLPMQQAVDTPEMRRQIRLAHRSMSGTPHTTIAMMNRHLKQHPNDQVVRDRLKGIVQQSQASPDAMAMITRHQQRQMVIDQMRTVESIDSSYVRRDPSAMQYRLLAEVDQIDSEMARIDTPDRRRERLRNRTQRQIQSQRPAVTQPHRTNKSGGPDRATRERLRQQAQFSTLFERIPQLQAHRDSLQRHLTSSTSQGGRNLPIAMQDEYFKLMGDLDKAPMQGPPDPPTNSQIMDRAREIAQRDAIHNRRHTSFHKNLAQFELKQSRVGDPHYRQAIAQLQQELQESQPRPLRADTREKRRQIRLATKLANQPGGIPKSVLEINKQLKIHPNDARAKAMIPFILGGSQISPDTYEAIDSHKRRQAIARQMREIEQMRASDASQKIPHVEVIKRAREIAREVPDNDRTPTKSHYRQAIAQLQQELQESQPRPLRADTREKRRQIRLATKLASQPGGIPKSVLEINKHLKAHPNDVRAKAMIPTILDGSQISPEIHKTIAVHKHRQTMANRMREIESAEHRLQNEGPRQRERTRYEIARTEQQISQLQQQSGQPLEDRRRSLREASQSRLEISQAHHRNRDRDRVVQPRQGQSGRDWAIQTHRDRQEATKIQQARRQQERNRLYNDPSAWDDLARKMTNDKMYSGLPVADDFVGKAHSGLPVADDLTPSKIKQQPWYRQAGSFAKHVAFDTQWIKSPEWVHGDSVAARGTRGMMSGGKWLAMNATMAAGMATVLGGDLSGLKHIDFGLASDEHWDSWNDVKGLGGMAFESVGGDAGLDVWKHSVRPGIFGAMAPLMAHQLAAGSGLLTRTPLLTHVGRAAQSTGRWAGGRTMMASRRFAARNTHASTQLAIKRMGLRTGTALQGAGNLVNAGALRVGNLVAGSGAYAAPAATTAVGAGLATASKFVRGGVSKLAAGAMHLASKVTPLRVAGSAIASGVGNVGGKIAGSALGRYAGKNLSHLAAGSMKMGAVGGLGGALAGGMWLELLGMAPDLALQGFKHSGMISGRTAEDWGDATGALSGATALSSFLGSMVGSGIHAVTGFGEGNTFGKWNEYNREFLQEAMQGEGVELFKHEYGENFNEKLKSGDFFRLAYGTGFHARSGGPEWMKIRAQSLAEEDRLDRTREMSGLLHAPLLSLASSEDTRTHFPALFAKDDDSAPNASAESAVDSMMKYRKQLEEQVEMLQPRDKSGPGLIGNIETWIKKNYSGLNDVDRKAGMAEQYEVHRSKLEEMKSARSRMMRQLADIDTRWIGDDLVSKALPTSLTRKIVQRLEEDPNSTAKMAIHRLKLMSKTEDIEGGFKTFGDIFAYSQGLQAMNPGGFQNLMGSTAKRSMTHLMAIAGADSDIMGNLDKLSSGEAGVGTMKAFWENWGSYAKSTDGTQTLGEMIAKIIPHFDGDATTLTQQWLTASRNGKDPNWMTELSAAFATRDSKSTDPLPAVATSLKNRMSAIYQASLTSSTPLDADFVKRFTSEKTGIDSLNQYLDYLESNVVPSTQMYRGEVKTLTQNAIEAKGLTEELPFNFGDPMFMDRMRQHLSVVRNKFEPSLPAISTLLVQNDNLSGSYDEAFKRFKSLPSDSLPLAMSILRKRQFLPPSAAGMDPSQITNGVELIGHRVRPVDGIGQLSSVTSQVRSWIEKATEAHGLDVDSRSRMRDRDRFDSLGRKYGVQSSGSVIDQLDGLVGRAQKAHRGQIEKDPSSIEVMRLWNQQQRLDLARSQAVLDQARPSTADLKLPQFASGTQSQVNSRVVGANGRTKATAPVVIHPDEYILNPDESDDYDSMVSFFKQYFGGDVPSHAPKFNTGTRNSGRYAGDVKALMSHATDNDITDPFSPKPFDGTQRYARYAEAIKAHASKDFDRYKSLVTQFKESGIEKEFQAFSKKFYTDDLSRQTYRVKRHYGRTDKSQDAAFADQVSNFVADTTKLHKLRAQSKGGMPEIELAEIMGDLARPGSKGKLGKSTEELPIQTQTNTHAWYRNFLAENESAKKYVDSGGVRGMTRGNFLRAAETSYRSQMSDDMTRGPRSIDELLAGQGVDKSILSGESEEHRRAQAEAATGKPVPTSPLVPPIVAGSSAAPGSLSGHESSDGSSEGVNSFARASDAFAEAVKSFTSIFSSGEGTNVKHEGSVTLDLGEGLASLIEKLQAVLNLNTDNDNPNALAGDLIRQGATASRNRRRGPGVNS